MTHPFAGIALHTWTLDTTPFPAALHAAKAAGFDAVEIRRADFLRLFARELPNAAILDLILKNGLPVAAVGVEYGWFFAQGEERRRLFAAFRESCADAVALGCPLLMSAIGPGSGTDGIAVDNVRRASDLAGEFGLQLTVEFQYLHPAVTSIDALRGILRQAGRANVRLLLDAYHLQRCGRGGRGFDDVSADEISYAQFSDVPDAPVPRMPATDRLPPGQGVVDWRGFFGLLAEKSYRGYVSYEAPNPAQWARPPEEVAREGLAATRAALAQSFP
ncbi:MAG: sugar phosphate isomerase/epimerase family protein [Variibacter sp.]